MKNKYRNIFLAFGIVAVLIMMFTFDMDYQELWTNLKRAGIYLPLVLILWLSIYLINTVSWYIIIRSGGKPGFSFARLYKFTVTGFALNYVTPVGLMGGEPYRIMELKPYIGVERATSSVILYVMMHAEVHREQLENIDQQIALLHRQKKQTFYAALSLEYMARVVSCLEIWLILNVLTTHVSFADCCLIAAFSSLLANLLFFLPMQLGGREGGFALAVGGLSLSGAYGVYAALITRVREMVWIVIGLALMKVGNKVKE